MFVKELRLKKLLMLIIAPALMHWSNDVEAQTYVTAPITGTPSPGAYYNNGQIQLGTSTQNFSVTATSANSWSFYISTDCIALVTSAAQSQNYIMTSIPRVAGNTLLTNPTSCDVMQNIAYYDALGRPLQTIQVKGSPAGNDVVQPFTYDALGREANKLLPYAYIGTADGSYKTDALGSSITSQLGFYQAAQTPNGVKSMASPKSVTVYESSPLAKVTEQGAPGDPWQPYNSQIANSGHTVKIGYDANSASAVILWTVNSTGATGGSTNYTVNQLYKTTTTDENGNNSITFKDKQGRILCKKIESDIPTATYISTYYLYDDYNNLRYVIPPLPAGTSLPATFSESDAIFKNYMYGYHYDERNRIIQKKMPGKSDWDYIVYNQLDQPVLTQDPNQRGSNQWVITKYDALGRVILTGLWNSGSVLSQTALQASIYAGIQYDARDYTNTTIGYNVTSYPALINVNLLTINYYDDYNSLPGIPSGFVVSGNSTMTKGQLTASKTTVLTTLGLNPDMLYTVHYYDDLGRSTKTFIQHYLGGTLSQYDYDEVSATYDFTNKVITTTRKHFTGSTSATLALTVANTYIYDHADRKLQTMEQINSGPNILLSQTDYNEIGQVKGKHLHSTTGGAPFLQDISYQYNERGWLKRINDPALTPSATRLFSEQLNYDSLKYAAVPQFNGNIAEQDFNAGVSSRQHVVYTYDPLNRLTAGTSSAGFSETGIAYDNLGNLLTLTRAGTGNGTLNYSSYTGNQLMAISGFKAGSYIYDNNGNMTADGPRGATIGYNVLNLPKSVTASTINIAYTYDANGNKLRKVSSGSSTDYINGIQYKSDGVTIDFIMTEEGRANNNSGTYTYEYTLTDHLGNNRVTFDQTNGAVGEDDYYPFGLNVHRHQNAGNKYLYNKKELQEEINEYDYGARFYDPVIGRWTSIDKLAEDPTQIDLSPYAYVGNDPISKDDPDGNCPNCVTAAIGAGIGAVFGAVIEGGSQIYNSGRITSWKAVGGSALQGAVTGGVAGFTGGASLLITAGASAGANVIGGAANNAIQGKAITVKSVAADAVIGVAAGVGGKLLDKGVKALSSSLSKAELKAVSSLEKNISEHQQKLKDYLADPMKFDNKGVLKNAPSDEVRDKIIAGRVKHLEKEIKTFGENIQKIKNKSN